MPNGDPLAVRVGPGWLYIAPLGSTEPDDLTDAWAVAWTPLGYTDEGSNFVFESSFEDVVVAEELDPIAIVQTARSATVNFALAEITAANMQRAFNGGDVSTATGVVTFEPPDADETPTPVMLGWESADGFERWVFRRCLQIGNVEVARKRAPDKATLPMSFRCTKPFGAATFKFMHDEDYA